MELLQCERNPLLIKVVLETLFEYLPWKTLLLCRQVNSIWKQEITFQLQKQGRVLNIKDENMFVQFTKACSNSGSFPIVNLRIGIFFEINSRSYNALKMSFQAISPWVAYLELILKPTTEHFKPELSKCWNFPKLENLAIHDLNSYLHTSAASSEPKYSIVNNIVERSPALKQFFYDSPFASPTTTEYISCLKLSMNSITHLTLMCSLSDATLETMTGIELKLKIFDMRLGLNSRFSSEMLRKFLETQKNTLEYLQMNTSLLCFGICDPMEFPQMTNLKQLYLQRGGNPEDSLKYGPLNKDNLPNLQQLTVETHSPTTNSKDIFENLQSGVCPSVKTLALRFNRISATTMQRAIFLFPKVVRLEVPAKQKILQVVFLRMSQLEDIQLNIIHQKRDNQEDTLLDYMILGRTQAECKEIKKICNGDWQQMLEYLKTKLVMKSIRSLKNLKKLDFNSMQRKVLGLSDLACAELLQMQSLQRVSLTELSTELISKSMMEKMQKQFKCKV